MNDFGRCAQICCHGCNKQEADGEHAGAVAVKALVGPLAVILLRLKELVVEINVVCSALRKLSRCQQQLDEQLVQLPVPLCHAAQCPHLGHGYADAR